MPIGIDITDEEPVDAVDLVIDGPRRPGGRGT